MRPILVALVCSSIVGYFAGCGSSGDSDEGSGASGGKDSGTGSTSGTGGSAGNGSGGVAASSGAGGAAAGSGTGGGAATGGGSSDAANLDDVSFRYDAGTEDSGFDPDSSCAATTVSAEPLPLDMYVILDKSGSMGTDCNVGSGATSKWCYAVNSLYNFFSAPTSAGTGVALHFFSGSSCGALTNPQVPYAVLPANLNAIQTALNGAVPSGNTPTSAAASGITGWTAANENPGRKMIGILITDGDPTSCTTSTSAINTILVNHFTATGIPTFVIGMTGATFGNLETIANNAGAPSHSTYCGGSVNPCHFYNVANGDPLVFAAVLTAIQQTAIGCQYTLPTSDAGLVDPDKVNVQYTPGAGGPAQKLPRFNDQASCGTSDGWYYDNNANPTLILLCPATCTKVTADPDAKIEIALGCLGS
jgi:hypothetical protein